MHETKCDDKYIGIHMTHMVRFLSMQKQNDNLTLSLGLLDKHMFVHVPSQGMDVQRHISWSFLCSMG